MPADLVNQEIGHKGLTELNIVNSMHERKWAMAELADGFLCLPGGPGTFEEIFEQWTWALLGFHAKPCGFVNVSGYYDPLRATVQQMADKGFLAQQYVDMLVYADTTAQALEAFRSLRPAAAQMGRGPGRTAALAAQLQPHDIHRAWERAAWTKRPPARAGGLQSWSSDAGNRRISPAYRSGPGPPGCRGGSAGRPRRGRSAGRRGGGRAPRGGCRSARPAPGSLRGATGCRRGGRSRSAPGSARCGCPRPWC